MTQLVSGQTSKGPDNEESAFNVGALFLDVGGVLIRTRDFSGREKWAGRFGLSTVELEALVFSSDHAQLGHTGKLSEPEIFSRLAATLNLSEADCRRFFHDFWGEGELDTELSSFAQSVRPRVKVGIIANAWSGARPTFVSHYGMDKFTDDIVISAEVGLAKPDEAIFKLAGARLDVALERSVFVDDRMENIEGAAALGMRAIRFVNTEQTIAELRRYFPQER